MTKIMSVYLSNGELRGKKKKREKEQEQGAYHEFHEFHNYEYQHERRNQGERKRREKKMLNLKSDSNLHSEKDRQRHSYEHEPEEIQRQTEAHGCGYRDAVEYEYGCENSGNSESERTEREREREKHVECVYKDEEQMESISLSSASASSSLLSSSFSSSSSCSISPPSPLSFPPPPHQNQIQNPHHGRNCPISSWHWRWHPRFPTAHFYIYVILILVTISFPTCHANPDAKRLYDDLLSNYNRLIRPVSNSTDKVLVRLGLRLSQLIDLNLKDQILTTNVWLEHEWTDHKFQWDPREYGGVTELYVPSEHIWLPDIVLYNNADGEYVVTTMTKAVLHSSGTVRWTPPAIFKSSCEIDVRYFPFDMQTCFMKFGSWTYDGFLIDLKHMNQVPGETQVPIGMDLREYYPSVEWDIISVPAERHEVVYACCKEPYLDIFFNITLRRRTLFYTVNLIVPTVGISYLSILVFYLPADSGEKIALCISILLSQTMFFLLISEIIPSTSLAVPLLGKYLLFTMFLVGLSVLVTTVVLNVHYRKPSTHKMARWVRYFFTRILPKFLLMRVPEHMNSYQESQEGARVSPSGSREEGCNGFQGVSRLSGLSLQGFSGFLEQGALEGFPGTPSTSYGLNGPEPDNLKKKLPFEIQKAIHNVEFIQTHMLRQDEFDAIDDDWKYIAMILDRLFLWIFNLAFFLGTIAILLEAPALYDYSESIDKAISIIAKKQYSPDTDI